MNASSGQCESSFRSVCDDVTGNVRRRRVETCAVLARHIAPGEFLLFFNVYFSELKGTRFETAKVGNVKRQRSSTSRHERISGSVLHG